MGGWGSGAATCLASICHESTPGAALASLPSSIHDQLREESAYAHLTSYAVVIASNDASVKTFITATGATGHVTCVDDGAQCGVVGLILGRACKR